MFFGLAEAPGFQKNVWENIAAQLIFFKICIFNLFNINKEVLLFLAKAQFVHFYAPTEYKQKTN